MKVRHIKRAIVITLTLFYILLAFWYVEVGNFSDANVQGVYQKKGDGETCTLTLRSDHSFIQVLDAGDRRAEVEGTWRLFPSNSQNHIAFSNTFLMMRGQMKSPDGTAFASLQNNFGLLSISLNSESIGPTFHKRVFH